MSLSDFPDKRTEYERDHPVCGPHGTRAQKVSTNIVGGVFIPSFKYDIMDPRLRTGEVIQEETDYQILLHRPDGSELELVLKADTPVGYLITRPDGTFDEEPNDVEVPLRKVVLKWEPEAHDE